MYLNSFGALAATPVDIAYGSQQNASVYLPFCVSSSEMYLSDRLTEAAWLAWVKATEVPLTLQTMLAEDFNGNLQSSR